MNDQVHMHQNQFEGIKQLFKINHLIHIYRHINKMKKTDGTSCRKNLYLHAYLYCDRDQGDNGSDSEWVYWYEWGSERQVMLYTYVPPSRKLHTLSSRFETSWNVSLMICCWTSSAWNKSKKYRKKIMSHIHELKSSTGNIT